MVAPAAELAGYSQQATVAMANGARRMDSYSSTFWACARFPTLWECIAALSLGRDRVILVDVHRARTAVKSTTHRTLILCMILNMIRSCLPTGFDHCIEERRPPENRRIIEIVP